MKYINKYLLITFFIAVILALPILTKIEKSQGVSVSENRALAKPPVLTAENVFSGAYLPGWNTYLSDHLWRRDDWLCCDTAIKLAAGHRVVRDVVVTPTALLPYIASDAPDPDAEPRAAAMADKYAALAKFTAEHGGVFLYINVPEQQSMFSGIYPAGMATGMLRINSQNNAFAAAMAARGVNYLDMRPVFVSAAADENALLYYARTDHHYNMRGAFLTYETLCATLSRLGVDARVKTGASFCTLTNTFNGSRGRKINNLNGFNDKLEYVTWDDPVPFTRFDNGALIPPLVYMMPASSEQEIEYTLYMGGDIPETIITTDRPELPNALIFGDSFTNALETVLYTSFNTTVGLDFRYNKTKSICDYIAEYKPAVVICLRDDTATLSADGNGGFTIDN